MIDIYPARYQFLLLMEEIEREADRDADLLDPEWWEEE